MDREVGDVVAPDRRPPRAKFTANERLSTGRPSTVAPVPCGGARAPESGQRWRIVGFSGIEVASSNTNSPVRLFAYAAPSATTIRADAIQPALILCIVRRF